MSSIRRVLFALLLAAAALPAAAQDALLGTWRSVEPDQEVLEFRADGRVRVGGTVLRFRATASDLTLQAPDGALHGTWKVTGSELAITLRVAPDDERTGRYRRVDGSAPRGREEARGESRPAAAETERVPGTRTTAAGLLLELPPGWSIARRDGGNLLLNPGLKETDTLDALICVLSGRLEAGERDQAITDLVRARLGAVAAELASQQIEMDLARAVIRRHGPRATLEAPGTAGGTKPVRIWLGATRDDARYAAVLAVILDGKVARFLPSAQGVFRTLAFAAADAAAGASLAGAEFATSTHGQGADALHTVYTFDGEGGVSRRTMFASPIGGMDSTRNGSYEVRGEALVMEFADGTVEAKLETEAGQVVALRVGRGRYARR